MVKYVIVADDLTGSNATCSLSSCVEELIKKQTKYTSHYFNDSFFGSSIVLLGLRKEKSNYDYILLQVQLHGQ